MPLDWASGGQISAEIVYERIARVAQEGALASFEEYLNEENPLDYTMDIEDVTLPRNLYGAQLKGESYTAITLSLPPRLRCGNIKAEAVQTRGEVVPR